jgi:gas vesicle protein
MITGLAIGLLLGAGVALLFAPERGADTRRVLRSRFRRAGIRGQDAWADLRLELKRARRELRRARERRELAAAEDVEV